MSPLELVDDRYEQLGAELRAARPVASAALRGRVVELARLEPAEPSWRPRRPSRRLVFALAAAALLGTFVAAGVTGLGGSADKRAAEAPGAALTAPLEQGTGVQANPNFSRDQPLYRAAKAAPLLPSTASDLAPTATRLQRYEAMLRLRVEDVDALSDATKRAMNLTRALGGYVGSIQYSTRSGKRGGANLVLRVPIGNVQTALAELSSLGTILQQRAAILDVTRRVDREARQIAKLERELATATGEEAAAIRFRLKTLRAKHKRLLRSAQLARIDLRLATPAKEAAASPSRFESTVDDAGAVLVKELEILLYALVVAGPLLLLGGVAIASARTARRRADRRLLERA